MASLAERIKEYFKRSTDLLKKLGAIYETEGADKVREFMRDNYRDTDVVKALKATLGVRNIVSG